MFETTEPSYLEKVLNNIKNTTINTYANIKNKTLSLKQQYWDKTYGGNHKRKSSRKRIIKTPYKRKRKNSTKRH